MMMTYSKLVLIAFVTLFTVTSFTLAQGSAAICTTIIDDALTRLADNCTDLSPNEVCHGSGALEYDAQQTSVASPDQNIDITTINAISSSAIDLNGNSIGTGAARLLSGVDDQRVYLMVIGDTKIENHSTDNNMPFHDITFETTSLDGCDVIHAALVIYIPDDASFVIRINKTVFRMQGLVTMQTVNANSLLAIVHSGEMEIVGREVVPSGQTISAITNAGEILTWSSPRTIRDTELQFGIVIASKLQQLSGVALDIDSSVTTTSTATSTSQPVQVCENSPVHTVLAGENLYQIALNYGVTIDSIVAANQLANASQIYPDQQLIIPCGAVAEQPETQPVVNLPSGTCGNNTVHTVEVGQTIYLIAQGYGTTADAIIAANNIVNPALIHVGDQLLVPCSTDQPPVNTNPPEQPPDQSPPVVQPPAAVDGFCSNFFALAPPGGHPQPMIDLYNQTCT